MYEDGGEVTIRNKTYPLVFNTAAWEEVNNRYGGLEEMGKKLQEDHGKAINEYAWILALLINQGIALKNFENGTEEKGVTPEQIKLLMLPKDITGQQEIIIDVINKCTTDRIAESEETEVDEVLEEVLASKNAEGAGE
jgi:hypothetical protein